MLQGSKFATVDPGSELTDLEALLDTDLEAAARGLGQEPKGPAFALESTRFHVHKRKADAKASRKGIKAQIKPANARAVLPFLPVDPDDRTHCVLRGDFVLCDLIPTIIGERGTCPHLHVATLGLSTANADQLARLYEKKHIGALTLVCSNYFAQVDKVTTFREVSARLGGFAKLVVTRSHCKVICLPTSSGDHYVIEGSANLRSSDSTEQILITNDLATLNFHREWIEELTAAHA